MSKKQQYTIRLDRDAQDHILPKDFFRIFVCKFLPVISLTYIVSIIGVAISKGDFIHYMFMDRTAYIMALFVVLWVSGPAIIWILLRGSPMFHHVSDLWYKIMSGLMVITITMSFLLFPEADIYGFRIYFILSIPVFILIYILLVKNKMPVIASYPLNALGFCALLWGAVVNFIF